MILVTLFVNFINFFNEGTSPIRAANPFPQLEFFIQQNITGLIFVLVLITASLCFLVLIFKFLKSLLNF